MIPDVFPGAKLMQLVEWGYPMGRLRAAPAPELGFSVIHITANPTASGEAEVGWRLDDQALQNSATFFNNRDGSAVQALGNPLLMDPWANGDVSAPDTSNPRIAAMVRDGVNANQRTLLAIENVGNEFAWKRADGSTVPGGYPITAAQEETSARQIAYYHPMAGLPITRETVIGHYQLNSTRRPNCPAADKSIVDRIVARARALTATEADMPTPPLEYVPQIWRAAATGADLREQASLATPVASRIPPGTPVFTVGEDPNRGPRWRLAVAGDPERLLYALRSQLQEVPAGAGRDQLLYDAIAAAVNARLAGQPVPVGGGISEAVLEQAKRLEFIRGRDETLAAYTAAGVAAAKEVLP